MFISAIGFAFLLGSLLGYRWLDIEYDQPGGGDPDIETDVHVGLYWTQSVIPTTNAFTGDEVPFISFQVTDNALFVANSYNQAGNNAGPVEVSSCEVQCTLQHVRSAPFSAMCSRLAMPQISKWAFFTLYFCRMMKTSTTLQVP